MSPIRLRLGTVAALAAIEQLAKLQPRSAQDLRKIGNNASLGVEVMISAVKPKRTLPQNARYWKIVSALADYVGLSKAEMHEEALCEATGFELVEFRGTVRKKALDRSSKMTRDDFSRLMMIVEHWAAEQGVMWEDEL